MRRMRRALTTAGFLSLALLPMMAAVPPEKAAASVAPSPMPVAIAQPLGTLENGPLAAVTKRTDPILPESGLLLLVGSALLGLATVVRRTT